MRKVLLALLLALLVGCGSNYATSTESIENNYVPSEMAYDAGYGESVNQAYVEEEKTEESEEVLFQDKLVYRGYLSIETLNYTDSLKALRERIKSYGGIIESESEYDSDRSWYYSNTSKGTRTIYLTIRIPTEKFEDFLNNTEGDGKVVERNSSVQNISKTYHDNAIEIEALQTQETRLLEMLGKANTIEEMLTIEDRLLDVQTRLNQKRSWQSQMDTDVEYSTVELELREVLEYSPENNTYKSGTFLDRLYKTVVSTWYYFWSMLEGLLFFLIRMIPVAIIVVPVIYFLRKLIIKKDIHFFRKKEDRE